MNDSYNLRPKSILYIVIFFVVLFFAGRIFFSIKRMKKISINFENLKNKKNIVPVAVIGSGPAGLAAALYSSRAGFHTVIFEGDDPGGQLMGTTFVDNYPGAPKKLGPDLIKTLMKQAADFGAVAIKDTVESVDFSSWPFILNLESGKTVNALSVIITTGAKARSLKIKGESDYWGKGVTTCATCDAPFYKDKNVFVVGGGDSAAEQAIQLSKYAKNITVLVRKDQMRASNAMQKRMSEYKNISVKYSTKLLEVIGDKKHVTSVKMISNKKEKTVKIDGIFLAIGHDPNSEIFKKFIPCDKHGYIRIMLGGSQKTYLRGVFAAGDIHDSVYRQAGVASGNGIKAALDATEFFYKIGYNHELVKKLKSNYFYPSKKDKTSALKEISSIKELKKFDDKILFLDFYTDSCPSCLKMLPIVETVTSEFKDEITVFKVNAMKSQELTQKFEIESVPTIIIIKNDEIISRAQTAMNETQLKAFIESSIE